VVDLDLEAFFDRVNHDRLMARLKELLSNLVYDHQAAFLSD
jgi:retron-type reverse transcriptase